jgi:ribosomal protein L11 methylase PrmA
MLKEKLAASFRDPSGFIFRQDGVVYRQVNKVYEEDFNHLETSGLLDELTSARLLIPHQKVDLDQRKSDEAVAVLRPENISFISYPYEWSFSQLKDAALLTLDIQKRAMGRGMCLRDASAYNVQFHQGKPIFIDTLSFEKYKEGQPWLAYRQFCQHFLAPLVLMSVVDPQLVSMSRCFIDGIPLDIASKMTKSKTRFNLGLALHLHAHAKAQKKVVETSSNASSGRGITKPALLGLIGNLETTVQKLSWTPEGTVWGDYYDQTNYTESSFEEKKKLVASYIDQIVPTPKNIWDLGANNGTFSRIASGRNIETVAFDMDVSAVEQAYLAQKAKTDPLFLPLLQDLTNPSPGLGWAGRERESLDQRGPADAIMALALVHHLAIGNNVPLSEVASYFAKLGKWLIIEFVPKEDSQVKRLLQSREDIFHRYTQAGFEQDFSSFYDLVVKTPITGTARTLYLYKRIND